MAKDDIVYHNLDLSKAVPGIFLIEPNWTELLLSITHNGIIYRTTWLRARKNAQKESVVVKTQHRDAISLLNVTVLMP